MRRDPERARIRAVAINDLAAAMILTFSRRASGTRESGASTG
jgi:hypothetical protein